MSRLRTVSPPPGFVEALSARLDEVQIPRYQRIINSLVATIRDRTAPVTAGLVAVSLAFAVLSVRSVEIISPVDQNIMAQMPEMDFHRAAMDPIGPKILPVRSEPVYSTPIPMTTADSGNIITASFVHH